MRGYMVNNLLYNTINFEECQHIIKKKNEKKINFDNNKIKMILSLNK